MYRIHEEPSNNNNSNVAAADASTALGSSLVVPLVGASAAAAAAEFSTCFVVERVGVVAQQLWECHAAAVCGSCSARQLPPTSRGCLIVALRLPVQWRRSWPPATLLSSAAASGSDDDNAVQPLGSSIWIALPVTPRPAHHSQRSDAKGTLESSRGASTECTE